MIRIVFIIFILFGYLFGEPIKVRLQWKHQFEFAGFYAALEKGYYKDAGLDVELLEYKGGDFVSELFAKDVDFTTLYTNAIFEHQQGNSIVFLANYFKRSPLALVVQPNIITPKDLKGKTIMASYGQIQNVNFQKMFLDYNITENDYKLISNSFDLEEFEKGKVDATSVFLTNEPYFFRKKKIPFTIMDPSHYGGELLYSLNLTTTKEYLKKYPKRVKNFVEATNKGWRYALNNKEEMVDLILKKYNTQNKSREHLLFEANETEKLMEPDVYEIGSIDLKRVKKIEELYIKLGKTKEFIDPKKFVYQTSVTSKIEFTDKELEFVQTHPNITFGSGAKWEPNVIVKEDGSIEGFEIDLLKEINKLTGLNIKIKAGAWGDITKEARAKKIDGLTDSWPSKEREKFFVFSDPYYIIKFLLVTKVGNPKNITSLADLKNIKFVKQKGIIIHDKLVSKYSDVEPLVVDGYDECINKVRKGEADATITSHDIWYRIYKNNDFSIYPILEFDKKIALGYSIRKDWSILKDIIDKALLYIPEEKMLELKQKWFFTGVRDFTKESLLSTKEKEWLTKHGTVGVCVDPNWRPVDYIDENGKYQGIGADYIDLISKKIGQKIELVKTKDWMEVIAFAKEGKCDLVSMMSKTPEREKYLDFTTPYFSNKNVIVTRDDVAYIDNIGNLKNETFGVVKGYVVVELLKKRYPAIKLKEVDSTEKGLREVEDKKIFGFIDIVPTVAWYMQNKGLVNLKISGDTGIPLNLSLATNKNIPELNTIFQKAVNSLSQSEKESILNKYINIRYEKGFDYDLFIKIVLFLSLLVFLIIYRHYLISRMNKELKYKVEKSVNDIREKDKMMLYQSRLAQMGEMLSMIAHQWRQPLNNLSILNQTITLKYKMGKLNDNVIETFENNSKLQIKQMSQTIDDFSEFFKPDKEKKEFFIREIIDKTIKILVPVFKKRDIKVTVNITEKIKMNSYENELGQVILNILSNAKDALIENKVTDKKIIIDVSKLNQNIILSITDNAGGVPKNIAHKIFDPYFSTKNDRNGTGLELYIAKIIVKDHLGGTIDLEVNKQSGCSTFNISLPLL